MNIELKKISFNERMSEETNCFVADLYIDGKKVGICKNDGCGGCTDYRGDTKEKNAIIAKAEEYCKTLPKEIMFDKEWNVTLEDVINKKFEEYIMAKMKAKEQKKMLKIQLTSIVFGVPNGNGYSYYNYKRPLQAFSTSALQTLVNNVRTKHCTDGVEILNTNLQELGIV